MNVTKKNIIGNAVFCSENNNIVKWIRIGDVVEVPFAKLNGEDGTKLVEVAHISNGSDAGDYGDIGYYYEDPELGSGQDLCSPDEIKRIWQVKP